MPEFSFDRTGMEEPRNDFENVPAGWYDVVISGSELKATKTGGQQMILEMTVTNGEYANRKLWYRINTENKNPEAVRIGMDQLLRLTSAIGVQSFDATEELHGRELAVSVTIKDDPQYGARNDIRGLRAIKRDQEHRCQDIQARRRERNVERAVAKPTPKAKVEPAADVPDDDIPF